MKRRPYETPAVVTLGSSRLLVNGTCSCKSEGGNKYKPIQTSARQF